MPDCICIKTMEISTTYNLSDTQIEMFNLANKPDVAQYLLDKLNECNCCAKHKKYRPDIYDFWKETISSRSKKSENGDSSTNICLCACRHTARQICRTFSNNTMTNYSSEYYAYSVYTF